MNRIFKTIYNSSEWLKGLKSIKDLERCPKKYKIKIIDLLYNFETVHNFYVKFINENRIKYIPTIKNSQISLNDYFQCLLLFNEILFKNFSFKNKKIQKCLKNFDYKKSYKFVRININLINGNQKEDLIKKYDLEETIIPNVFKIYGKIDLNDKETLIYQSFSSCVPAFLLNPAPNSNVFDACASPGNKTNHLSCIMENTGRVFAYEIDKKRFDLLKIRLTQMNSNNIEFFNEDFNSANPEISPDYILVDPSCSGSGMKDTFQNENLLNGKLSELIKYNGNIKTGKFNLIKYTNRSLNDLYSADNIKVNVETQENIDFSQSQLKLLEKAISLNPKRIVYSTCSVYEVENEKVIEKCLKKFPNFEVEKIEIKWDTRGLKGYLFAEFCLRVYPDGIHTGFFVVSLINKNSIYYFFKKINLCKNNIMRFYLHKNLSMENDHPTLNDFLILQTINNPIETKIPINLTLLYNFSKELYQEFTDFFLGKIQTPNTNFNNFIEAQLSKEIMDIIFIKQNIDYINNQILTKRDLNQIFHLFNPLPTSTIPISFLRPSIHLNSILAIPGIVTKVGNIVPELLIGVFRCNVCGIISDPVIQEEEYTIPIICKNQVCGNRAQFTIIDNYNDMSNYEYDTTTKEMKFQMNNNEKCKFGNLQRIVIQEEINYQNKESCSIDAIPRVLTCILRNDLCDSIKPGDKVKLIGKLAILTNHNTDNARLQTVKSIPTLSGFGEEIRKRRAINFKDLDYIYQLEVNSAYILDSLKMFSDTSIMEHANTVEEIERIEEITTNNYTVEQLKRIENMRNTQNIYSKLANSIFPSIQGHLNIKKAILLQLISGVTKDFSTLKIDNENKRDTTRLRGDINIIMIGDPGTAKSQFLKQASKILLNSIYTTGKTSTAAGLTAAVVKDATTSMNGNKYRGDFSIEPGALVLADNSLCCIDEFDKISMHDRVSIHEAMEQQTISIAKAGLHCTLNARTAILAAANPIGGRYDETKSLYQNINLSTPIFSRFDLCFVLIDEKSEVRDWNIADKIIKNHVLGNHSFNPTFSAEELKEEDLFSIKDSQLFIHSVKDLKPLMPPSTQLLISKKFVALRKLSALTEGNKKGYKFTVRHLESIIRLSEAQAKLFNDTIVREEYVEEACRLLGCAGTSNSNLSSVFKEPYKTEVNSSEMINLSLNDKENTLNDTNKKIINSEKFFKIMNAYIFLLKTHEQMTEEEIIMSYLEMMVDEKGIENEREWNNEELQKEKDLSKNVLEYLILKENVLIRAGESIMLHPMYDA